jgi:hypothetical protein
MNLQPILQPLQIYFIVLSGSVIKYLAATSKTTEGRMIPYSQRPKEAAIQMLHVKKALNALQFVKNGSSGYCQVLT